jgi:hypothetical protein
MQHYDVLVVQGHEKLIVPMTDPNTDTICTAQVIRYSLYPYLDWTWPPVGDVGVLLSPTVKHFKRLRTLLTEKEVENKGIVLQPIVFLHLDSRCQVELTHQSHPDGNDKLILVHQDHLRNLLF